MTVNECSHKFVDKSDVAEVLHGVWNIKEFGITKTKKIACSVCGYSEHRGPAWGISWGFHNYCPNCGAKMDGKGDTE